ncbi:response regulator [Curvivirga aplysinae]|uniref:response regulator n=1 Tax=Curvivirga aplysinae TaxID=2529852 RepID=UPI0012BB95C0|nr:response regulator [Curvivirga aplysinae]MTI08835.1 response regulator [Curvivirga aplysinae]
MAIRVLIVDDQKINRMLNEALIKAAGHEAIQAESGREAIFKLRSEQVDIILMDIEMPDMNGVEATQLIRKTKVVPDDLPIVAITANSEEDRAEYIAAGMQGYVQKPISAESLAEVFAKFKLG